MEINLLWSAERGGRGNRIYWTITTDKGEKFMVQKGHVPADLFNTRHWENAERMYEMGEWLAKRRLVIRSLDRPSEIVLSNGAVVSSPKPIKIKLGAEIRRAARRRPRGRQRTIRIRRVP